MKTAELIGNLMPSHPDFQPIIQELREKYQLNEVNPEEEPINEIFLEGESIPLKEFRQEIRKLVEEKTSYLPPEYIAMYKLKDKVDEPLDLQGMVLPDKVMPFIEASYAQAQKIMKQVIPAIDAHYESVTNMLYIYLLTGETEEIPTNWLSQVSKETIHGQIVIHAVANQASDPEIVIQQFRELYKKTFGTYRPKITKTMVSTAHYMQLERLGKKWDFIVEEYIRLNKFRMPRDIHSKRYAEVWQKYSHRLRKRMQRAEPVLNILLEDKK